MKAIERYQLFIYLIAIGCGLALGGLLPDGVSRLEAMLWPALALLLYTSFTMVPLAHLREAIADRRFLAAATIGNFLVLPLLVWMLLWLVPDDPALRLGVLLVLLAPCTDWFISFAQLGRGDARHAIAFTPFSLLLQLILLPVYLWVFLGETFTTAAAQREMLFAFAALIVLPLIAAAVTEKRAERRGNRKVLDRLAWFPVPLLALVVFIIAATQAGLIAGSLATLARLLPVFVVFLLAAGLVAWALARAFRLPPAQGRVLAFSFGTRNSFVVLPLALALPPPFELAALAIVFQSLVELVGMAVYLWWVPNRLFTDRAGQDVAR